MEPITNTKMALLKVENKKGEILEKEIPDGESIAEAAEELGIVFGCHHGKCGVCMVRVLEGEDNLGEKTAPENLLKLPEGCRLCCQAKIIAGEVLVKQNIT
tara:strand:- start:369 stop:671 length:303 start_codon:yes stop_codon:yes gene_type:complete